MVEYKHVTHRGKTHLKVGSLVFTSTEVRLAAKRNNAYLKSLKKKGKTVRGKARVRRKKKK